MSPCKTLCITCIARKPAHDCHCATCPQYKLLHCFKVNGGIFLGSVVWWQWVLQPLLSWLLSNFVQPVAGQWATSTFESALQLVYQVVWLAPVYVVTFAVSCSLYSDMAAEAVQVRQRHAASLLAAVQQHGSTAGVAAQESVQQYGSSNGYGSQPGSLSASHPPPSSLATSSSSKGGAAPDVILGGVAQELYRTVLFAVLYGEVWLAGCLPVVGECCACGSQQIVCGACLLPTPCHVFVTLGWCL